MDRRVVSAQSISRMCLVCGTENEAGLHARFYNLEGDEVLGVFEAREIHQGYPERLHGGIASTMLDETIGRALNITDPDAFGVTVELTVRFRKPVPLDGPIRVLGRITRDSSRLFEGTGEIVLDDGSVAVEASGKYMKMPIDRIAEGDFDEEWFDDTRERPETVDV
jgi:acyl-coenzyme A thioesterase PaaI-like protein